MAFKDNWHNNNEIPSWGKNTKLCDRKKIPKVFYKESLSLS